jgi:hypothetical protein
MEYVKFRMKVEDAVEDQHEFIQRIIDNCGPRLPGSEEERKAAYMIADEFEKLTGNKTVEEFELHPLAFIGWIPIAGILLFVAAALIFVSPWITGIMVISILAFAVIQFIKYLEWFDFLFPKAKSQNVYSIIEPPSGVTRYTIILGGHIDSSWCWLLPLKSPEKMRYKIIYGFVGAFALIAISVLLILESYIGPGLGSGTSFTWLYWVIPFFLPGFWYIHRFLTWDKKWASPGAMDDLSGIAQAISLVKYYKIHPEDMPKDCRIILAGFGGEEAGLRGSRAFAKKHKDDLLAGDVWVLNIDGVSDVDHFNLMKGEVMLNVNYNKDFVNIVTTSMKEFGLEKPFWKLDVGASDAVTFTRYKKRAYTFCAQDNTPRSNYHTKFDTWENLNPDALRKMMILLLRVIEKIDIYVHDYQPEWLVDFVEQSRFIYKVKKAIEPKKSKKSQ